jgi:hypothetical protein
MDRRDGDTGAKTTNDIVKERTGRAIGERHPDTGGQVRNGEGPIRGGADKAMDAVREVVNAEKK